MSLNILKILIAWMTAFFAGVAITPFLTHYLYKNKMWKKKARTKALSGGETVITSTLESQQQETGTPRMGGIVIWGSVLITIFVFWLLPYIFPEPFFEKLDFMSRTQTWLPLFTLISASLLGLVDDFLVVFNKGGYIAGGIPLKIRIGAVLLIGLIGALWFYNKLGVSAVFVPFGGVLDLGIWFIPFFMLVMLALFSTGVIDGIDGLSGGIMASIFSAYAGIAFFQNQLNLATFCVVIVGGILAFLWFNIPPARFYMSETGILGLTTTLTVVAFLTGHVLILPIIAFPLFITTTSVIIQMTSKKFRGKKVFLVAPIHHHFEALGWPSHKVTMRFWIIGVISAILGVIIVLIG